MLSIGFSYEIYDAYQLMLFKTVVLHLYMIIGELKK